MATLVTLVALSSSPLPSDPTRAPVRDCAWNLRPTATPGTSGLVTSVRNMSCRSARRKVRRVTVRLAAKRITLRGWRCRYIRTTGGGEDFFYEFRCTQAARAFRVTIYP